MLVKDVMTREVVSVTPSAPLKEAARLLVDRGVSGMPVVEEGKVVGVLSERDFLIKEQGRPESSRWLSWLTMPLAVADDVKLHARTVRGAMTSPAVTVTESTPIPVAARRMLEAGVKRLPVVDGEQLVGIVTRTDLVRAFARPDDEIEAEINEEIFGRQLWLDRETVHASVHDGNVQVDGSGLLDIDSETVERFVSTVPGVVSVVVRS